MTNHSIDRESGQPASHAQSGTKQSQTPGPSSAGDHSRRSGEQQHDRIRERYYKQGSDPSQSGYGNQSDPASRDATGDASEPSGQTPQGTPPPDRWQPALDEAKIESGQQQGPDPHSQKRAASD